MRRLMMALVVLFALPAASQEKEVAVSDASMAVGVMSTVTETEVRHLHFMSSGAVLFHTTTARTDVPACAAGQTTRWAIDANTAAGKAQLAGLLAAHATGKKMSVFGTNTCTIWADTESVSYLLMR
ncbi:hypothetical protein [Pseudoxanthomonas sp. UTMC 1351]|uniref:hypothetical protein n=1 Tax=Pseudoxanthomonas sp. UTMC 1351 TaxID=2695853 RepID=UPI0034CF635A